MKIFRVSLVVLVVLLLVAVVGVWMHLRSSLPQLEGIRSLEGLGEPVTVLRDAQGVATLEAETRLDATRALGFVHGQERFFQMDLLRRHSAGELAALLGTELVSVDTGNRPHRFRPFAERRLDTLSEEDRRLLEAYAEGVNAGVEALAARPWEYMLLGVGPQAWRPEDSFLVAFTMYLRLQGALVEFDLALSEGVEELPVEVRVFFLQEGSGWDAPLVGEAVEIVPVPEEAAWGDFRGGGHAGRAEGDRFPVGGSTHGSNAWVVSGEHTQSGRPILANDMHLGLSVPHLWFRAALVYTAGEEAVRVEGLTLPGMPLLVAGGNGRIAWGFTNANVSTWQIFRTEGAPVTTHTKVIEVRGAEEEVVEFKWTDQGRVIAPGVAVRWMAYHPAAVCLTSLELETAANAGEAVEIAHRSGFPVQNFFVADAEGNIGWTLMGTLPPTPAGPVGTLHRAGELEEWEEVLPPEDFPGILNPASGLLWSGNHRKGDAAPLRNGLYPTGARAHQIRERLRALEDATPEDHLAIQLDHESFFLRRWRDLLVRVLEGAEGEGDPRLEELRALVEEWDGIASVDSAGYLWVRLFRDEVYVRVVERFLPVAGALIEEHGMRASGPQRSYFEEPVWQLVDRQPAFLVHPEFESWEEELLSRVRKLLEDRPGDPGGHTWGEENRAVIRHPLSGAVPLIERWLDMPDAPMDGDHEAPRVARGRFSASNRTVIPVGREGDGFLQMPAGQAGHPLSPYFGAGHEAWSRGEPTPYRPGEAKYRLMLVPVER